MTDAELTQRRRGDERLMLMCVAVERLCAEHVPASVRLEAELGQLEAQRLVAPLAQRLTTRAYADRHSYEPAHAFAAA